MPKDHVTLCWIATGTLSSKVIGELQGLLSAPERDRAARFVFDRDRSEFVAVHALARSLLGQSTGQAPSALRMRHGRFGKPELVAERDAPPPAFNLSHSRGLAVVAFGQDVALGVDVENVTRPAPLEIAERFFAPDERAALRDCQPCHRQSVFYSLWTLKEAYMKATGLGMNMSPERIGFSLEPIEPLFDPGFEGRSFWQFMSLRTGPDHITALALGRAEDRPLTVSVREIGAGWFLSLYPN